MYPYLIGSHIVFALASVILGAVLLLMPKGTPRHKLIGRIWVSMMALVAIGSFAIHDLNPGGLSWIHVLSAFTLMSMAFAIIMIRKGHRRAHFSSMIGSFIGLVVAGIFTLLPNRIIGGFFFGP